MLPMIGTGSNGSRQDGANGAPSAAVLAGSRTSTGAGFMNANYRPHLLVAMKLRLPNKAKVRNHHPPIMKVKRGSTPLEGRDLIGLAQKLARDAERHAILSASLASQADRLMVAGLRLLEPPPPDHRVRPSH